MALSPILPAKSFFIVPSPFPASLSFQSMFVVHVVVVGVVVVLVAAVVVAVSGPVGRNYRKMVSLLNRAQKKY